MSDNRRMSLPPSFTLTEVLAGDAAALDDIRTLLRAHAAMHKELGEDLQATQGFDDELARARARVCEILCFHVNVHIHVSVRSPSLVSTLVTPSCLMHRTSLSLIILCCVYGSCM